MPPKPIVILVHGAWHRPSHWSVVTEELKARGYEVDTPALPSATTTSIDDPLAKDIAYVKQTLGRYAEDGKDVVLVMHSYGGVPSSEAVAELHGNKDSGSGHGRILHLFYISSHILEPGSSVASDDTTQHVWDLQDGLLHHLEPYNRFYNTTPPNIARSAISQLVPHSLHSFTAHVERRGYADCGIPVTYLACKQDRALEYNHDLMKYQKRLQNASIEDLTIHTIDSDHTPWLSAQADFFKILGEVLDKAAVKT